MNDHMRESNALSSFEQMAGAELEQVVNDLDSLLRKLEACSPSLSEERNSRLHLLELRSAILELDLFNRKFDELCEDLSQTKYGLEQMTNTAAAELRRHDATDDRGDALAGRHHKLLIDESASIQQAITNLQNEVAAAQHHLLVALRQTSLGVFNLAAAVMASGQAPARVSDASAADHSEISPLTIPPADVISPSSRPFVS